MAIKPKLVYARAAGPNDHMELVVVTTKGTGENKVAKSYELKRAAVWNLHNETGKWLAEHAKP